MKTVEAKHLLIENPLTGKMVNVMPIFELMSQRTESCHRGPGELVAFVDRILRHVVTNISDDIVASDIELICIRLYEMRDAFTEMDNF